MPGDTPWPAWMAPGAPAARLTPGRTAVGADGNYSRVTIDRVGARHVVDSAGRKYRPDSHGGRDIHASTACYLVAPDDPVLARIDEQIARRRAAGTAEDALADWRREGDPADLAAALDALAPFTDRITPI